ncbi:hypothetical protein BEP19_16340 [Ammoniphilus oxalaticus]|uniref:Uncharacterized protein n=1 Tax=Ammoniphilus oxalaticus TaxID=66863 RepID=A0A419SQU9_9BACL|nr:hypothetical protein [Ammoniphilus oxalaticus]RKD26768.1 hypothetical protein BEP19_16340 [Ammoniphilus oxalaticus]
MSLFDYLDVEDALLVEAWIQEVETEKYPLRKSLKEKARERFNDIKLKELGCGKKRIVFDLDNGWVLKIAIAFNGINNNQREVEMYQSAPPRLQKRLAKIKEFGHGWLVMQRITKPVPKKKGIKAEIKKIIKQFERSGIIPGDLISPKRRIRWPNIRLRKGRIVVIDYGNFKWK